LAILVITSITNQWVIVPAILLLAAMMFLRWYFLKTSREVKRLEAQGEKEIM